MLFVWVKHHRFQLLPFLQKDAQQCLDKKDQISLHFYRSVLAKTKLQAVCIAHHFYLAQKQENLHLNFDFVLANYKFYWFISNKMQSFKFHWNVFLVCRRVLRAFLYHRYLEHTKIIDHKVFLHFIELLLLLDVLIYDEPFLEIIQIRVNQKQPKWCPNIYHHIDDLHMVSSH